MPMDFNDLLSDFTTLFEYMPHSSLRNVKLEILLVEELANFPAENYAMPLMKLVWSNASFDRDRSPSHPSEQDWKHKSRSLPTTL